MKRPGYQPSAPAPVEAREDNGRWTLVFTRELRHAPERVWTALTDPSELREWAPFDSDRDLGKSKDATLTMADAGGALSDLRLPAKVRRAEKPKLLEYTWGNDVLRWELERIASGTRLTLYHTLDDRNWVPKTAAGWHMCLDVMDRLLSGSAVGRIVAADATDNGWEQLNDTYARQLGIVSTGWPDTSDQSER